jgi:hypothetical protein
MDQDIEKDLSSRLIGRYSEQNLQSMYLRRANQGLRQRKDGKIYLFISRASQSKHLEEMLEELKIYEVKILKVLNTPDVTWLFRTATALFQIEGVELTACSLGEEVALRLAPLRFLQEVRIVSDPISNCGVKQLMKADLHTLTLDDSNATADSLKLLHKRPTNAWKELGYNSQKNFNHLCQAKELLPPARAERR